MSQFDFYRNPNPDSGDWAPYIIDLQHDMLSALATRIMAPLVLAAPAGEPTVQRLNPVVTIDGRDYFLSTSEMASVPARELSEAAGNLASYRDELMAAIDILFTAI